MTWLALAVGWLGLLCSVVFVAAIRGGGRRW